MIRSAAIPRALRASATATERASPSLALIPALPVFLSTSNEDRAQIDPSLSPDGILECPNKSCSIGSKYIIDGKLYFALNNNILIED